MSFFGSPPAMKCTWSAAGGTLWVSTWLPAISACAISWPPYVRPGFLVGCDPRKVSSSTRSRFRIVRNCSKSLANGALLRVVLPDPVHMNLIVGAAQKRIDGCLCPGLPAAPSPGGGVFDGPPKRSERLFTQVHHRQVDICGDPAVSGQPRQHALDEKVCRSDFSVIERPVGRCRVAIERRQRDLSVAKQ